ncbi:response regulator [Desulfobacterales bacterium HSG16]|nr:response regulator [Desulfobacterales bacterium HSG16]
MNDAVDWKVVLIDDEEGIRKVTRITLEDAGYTVYTAENGKAGLKLCSEILPQIVITDVRMPGMDGIAVLEAIKKDFPDIEVIVATAFGEMDLAIRALQLDASDFITKPLNDKALHVALERAKKRYKEKKQLKDYTVFLENGWTETTQELIEAFSFQQNLIESSMNGIAGCNGCGIFITFNRSMEKMLGYAKSEVLHKMNFDKLFLSEEQDRFYKELKGKRYGGKNRLFMFETNLKGKDDSRIPVQLSASVIFNQQEEDGLVCIFRDLREIRKLEREVEDQARILHQDKMMSLGCLAASVVHEINNPLAGILNYSRLMLRIVKRGSVSKDHKKKFVDYLNLMEKETDRCSQIVSSLLTFSRKSAAEFGLVSIDELLQRCILLSQHKLKLSNISFEHDITPNLPQINGNFNQLQQCIINLIFNAIDAMPSGGKLFLSANSDTTDKIVTITVKDTGTGIDDEHLPHIFEPFFTTKNEGYGVGLGLSTLYGIIEEHDAAVDVKTRADEGTSFILKFKST